MRLEYERERTRLLDLYGNSSGEAAAANGTKHRSTCSIVRGAPQWGYPACSVWKVFRLSTVVENRGSGPFQFHRAPLPLLPGAY
jgi:hypothetical protein